MPVEYRCPLDQAADAAADVDRERGSVDRDGDPTGWGELLAGLALRLRRDAQGRARTGRKGLTFYETSSAGSE